MMVYYLTRFPMPPIPLVNSSLLTNEELVFRTPLHTLEFTTLKSFVFQFRFSAFSVANFSQISSILTLDNRLQNV